MVLKVLWIKILFIKLTNSTKHSLMLAKTGIEVLLMHEFMHPEPFIVLFQQTCPIHYFRSKTQIFGIFTPFRCSKTSIWFHTTYFTSKTRVHVISRPFVAAPGPL